MYLAGTFCDWSIDSWNWCELIRILELDSHELYFWVKLHTHTRLTALCPGLPRWASTRKVKPIWILPKQETVSGSGFSWARCKSAPHSRQITMPASHHSVFYRPDALPAAQPTASKHWRLLSEVSVIYLWYRSYSCIWHLTELSRKAELSCNTVMALLSLNP